MRAAFRCDTAVIAILHANVPIAFLCGLRSLFEIAVLQSVAARVQQARLARQLAGVLAIAHHNDVIWRFKLLFQRLPHRKHLAHYRVKYGKRRISLYVIQRLRILVSVPDAAKQLRSVANEPFIAIFPRCTRFPGNVRHAL